MSGKEPISQCKRHKRQWFSPWFGKIPCHGKPLQYSCLEHPMHRAARWAMVHGLAKSQTRLKWLSTQAPHPKEKKLNMRVYTRCFREDVGIWWKLGFPSGSIGKESACNAGDPGSIPRLGRSPREGNGNPIQYSFLENSMDIGAGQAIVDGITKSQTWLCGFHFFMYVYVQLPLFHVCIYIPCVYNGLVFHSISVTHFHGTQMYVYYICIYIYIYVYIW